MRDPACRWRIVENGERLSNLRIVESLLVNESKFARIAQSYFLVEIVK